MKALIFTYCKDCVRDITERPEFPYIVDWPQAPTVEKDDPDPVDEAFDILTGGENNA